MSAAAVLARAGRAEWSRIWTVRSSWAFAVAVTTAVVGLAALIGGDVGAHPPATPPESGAWQGGRLTAMVALFGAVAMAVVAATADHGTGGIVTTLQWTPRRGLLLTARTTVVVATTTALGLLAVTAAALVVHAYAPGLGLPVRGALTTLGEVALVLACGALLGVGLGLGTRSVAAGLVAALALLLVLPLLVAQLPYAWTTRLAAHLPGSGALFLVFGEGPLDDMTTTSARLTLAGWAAAAMLAGGWRLLRSDAR